MNKPTELTEHEAWTLNEIVQLRRTMVCESIERAGSAEEMRAAIARASVIARIMRGAEQRSLALDVEIVAELEHHAAESVSSVAYERESLVKFRAGDQGCRFSDDASPEDTERTYEELINGELDEIAGCRSILARAAGEAVA